MVDKSLMHMEKNVGPITEPGGMPECAVAKVEQ